MTDNNIAVTIAAHVTVIFIFIGFGVCLVNTVDGDVFWAIGTGAFLRFVVTP